MKKIFKNAIFTCLFVLCCVFTFFCTNSLSIKVNAIANENQTEENVEQEEEKEGKTYTYSEEGEGEITITLYEDGTCVLVGFIIESQETIETQATYQIVDNNLILLINDVEYIFTINEETMTATPNEINEPDTPNDELPNEDEQEITKEELKEEIEGKLIEIKDWIIALIASFLGTSGLVAFVKILLNKWFNTQEINLKTKLDQMEQEKKIAVEQKEVILEQFNKLTERFNEVLEYNEKLCEYITTKIKADEEKVFKTNQLLQALLPVLEEEKSDVDEK